MPPKVSRTSTVRTIPQKKTTVSSSKSTSKSSSTTSSKSTVSRPTTSTVRSAPPKPAPAPAQKPRNVDKVDFGKPKPPKVTYDAPTPPTKTEKTLQLEAEARANALAELPSRVREANQTWELWQKADSNIHNAERTLMYAKAKAEENLSHPIKTTITMGVSTATGISAGFGAGEIAAEASPDFAAKIGAPVLGAAGGSVIGLYAGAKEVLNTEAIEDAEKQLEDAKKDARVLYAEHDGADYRLKLCIMMAAKQRMRTDDMIINYPTNVADLRREFKL